MRTFLTLMMLLLLSTTIFAQTGPTYNTTSDYKVWGKGSFGKGDNTPTDPSAILELGKPGTDKGLLLPRITDTAAVVSPKAGLLVYVPADEALAYFDGFRWQYVTKGAGIISVSRGNDTLYFELANGITVPVKMDYYTTEQANDSLSRKVDTIYWNSTNDTLYVHTSRSLYRLPAINWQTLLTPLLSQPAVPVQPTNTIPEAIGKLQSQINAYDGTYIKLISATPQPGASAYVQGKINIKGNTGTTYGLMLERINLNTDDNTIGFKSVNDTIGRLGMLNRGLNYMRLDNLRDNIIIAMRDTARIEFVTMNPNSTGKIGLIFNDGYIKLGDSLSGAKIMPKYPIEITNDYDTSISALHKIYTASTIHAAGGAFSGSVTGVTESLSDVSTKLSTTAYVKGQNYTTPQNIQQVLDVGNTSTTRMILNAAVASAYALTLSNTGTGAYHGLYINTSSASTGNVLRADRNGVQKFLVDSDGETTVTSFATPVNTVTGNITLDATHFTLRVNNTGSATITLPTASTCPGRIYVVKKISAAANDVVITGVVTLTLQNSSVMLQSNGTAFEIIAGHAAATTY